MTYFSPSVSSTNVRVGYLNLVKGSITVQRNYLVGGTPTFETGYWTTVNVANDTLIGAARVLNVREADLTGYTWTGNRYFRDTTATAWQYNGSNYTLTNFRTASGIGSID